MCLSNSFQVNPPSFQIDGMRINPPNWGSVFLILIKRFIITSTLDKFLRQRAHCHQSHRLPLAQNLWEVQQIPAARLLVVTSFFLHHVVLHHAVPFHRSVSHISSSGICYCWSIFSVLRLSCGKNTTNRTMRFATIAANTVCFMTSLVLLLLSSVRQRAQR